MRPVILVSFFWLVAMVSVALWAAREHKLAVEWAAQNSAWRQTAGTLEQERDEIAARLQGGNVAGQRPTDAAEKARLTQELQNLRRQLSALEQLSAEHQRLQAEVAWLRTNQIARANGEKSEIRSAPSPSTTRPAPSSGAPPAEGLSREKLEAWMCLNHLHQIQFAAEQFALRHHGLAPTSFFDLKEWIAPMLLVCPGASPKSGAESWPKFDPATVTYRMKRIPEMWFPRFPDTRSHPVTHSFVVCPIHRAEAFNDTHAVVRPLGLVD